MVKTMAKLRMAHPSTHGARKPPGPIVAKMLILRFKSSSDEKKYFFMVLEPHFMIHFKIVGVETIPLMAHSVFSTGARHVAQRKLLTRSTE